ncbi:MAG: ribbon-helix-helix protein, CopG family [Candidatus Binatia bacterium]
MKNIAVTIDEPTLKLLDELASAAPRPRSRSALVRLAVRALVERELQRQSEAREHDVIRRHAKRLAQEAKALVAQQARP